MQGLLRSGLKVSGSVSEGEAIQVHINRISDQTQVDETVESNIEMLIEQVEVERSPAQFKVTVGHAVTHQPVFQDTPQTVVASQTGNVGTGCKGGDELSASVERQLILANFPLCAHPDGQVESVLDQCVVLTVYQRIPGIRLFIEPSWG